MRSLTVLPLALVASFTLVGGEARADKKGRIHADSEVLGFSHIDPDGGGSSNATNAIGVGLGRPTLNDAGYYIVPPRSLFGLGGAFGFARERAFVGAKVAFLFDTTGVGDDDDVHASFVGGQFVPYFQWIFLPGRKIRPWVEARVGMGGGASSFDFNDEMDSYRRTDHLIYPLVGGGGGAHFFVVDAFSIDLGLNVDYLAPHGRTTRDDDVDLGEVENWNHAADVVNLSALLGLSVWLP
jgi:hypothetical protein